jgi:fermentation-respiration switch protein FrsA (DUF1100 family)
MASIARQTVITLLVALLGGLFILIFCAWMFQERIAFQPQGPPYPDPGDTRRVSYSASDGQNLFAYMIGDPATSPGLVIAFHGNADVAVGSIAWANEVHERTGLSVMLPEYRGYMGLDGRPGYENVRRDADAAYEFALDTLGASENRMALFGHSLGSAVAAELAVKHLPRALILEAPFTSAEDMAAIIAGQWLRGGFWRLISRLHFDTVRIVASLNAPVSVVHGGRDRVVPSRMGEAVYRAAKVKGEWLFLPKASHSDVRYVGGDAYWSWLVKALAPLTSSK